MTTKELADFGKAVTSGLVPDRVVPILADVTHEVRGAIATWTQNKLSANPDLIPASFKRKALDLARWSVLTSIPGYLPGKAREDANDRAEKFFAGVGRGNPRPEAPEDAVTPDVPSEKPAGAQWRAPERRAGRARMNGL
jgi:hypothetical protein